MKKLFKKIIKEKKKEIRDIRRSFDEPLIKAAAFSVGGEFRSVEINIQQSTSFPVLIEMKAILFPEMWHIQNFNLLKIAKHAQSLDLQTAFIVATDEKYLGGNTSWINLIKYNTEAPVLRRDFFINPAQMYQTKAIGADGIILDPFFLDEAETRNLLEANYTMGLEAFLEVGKKLLPLFIDSELFQGIIVENRDVELQPEALSDLRRQYPDSKITILKALPKNFEEMAAIPGAGFDAILLNDDIWRSNKSIFEIFQQVSNWSKILGKSTNSQ